MQRKGVFIPFWTFCSKGIQFLFSVFNCRYKVLPEEITVLVTYNTCFNRHLSGFPYFSVANRFNVDPAARGQQQKNTLF